MTNDLLSLFIFIAGLIIGLGAVTVIDIHGFLGRKSEYWTEATTKTHKVTKPLIWVGIACVLFGGLYFYFINQAFNQLFLHLGLCILLILNGIFLSFSVSPHLLKREKAGRANQLLSKDWQRKITISFIFSFVGWWGIVFLLVKFLSL